MNASPDEITLAYRYTCSIQVKKEFVGWRLAEVLRNAAER